MSMPWHPMHSLRPGPNQERHMWDGPIRVAIIRPVRITRLGKPATTSWRSVTGDHDPRERELVGYFETLEDAAVVTWRNWSQRHLPIEERFGVQLPRSAARFSLSLGDGRC
ncbi:hypothetical protein [Leucobacter luti]|uniref:hypothetical protein n=1 Tax=Leucobacter luti TaxID=340320 RepID=UPI003D01EB94